MTHRQLNIFRTYSNATAEEIDNGLRWYATAHDEAKRLHENIRIGAAVIAAVSPGLRWERNIEAAERILASRTLNGLGVRWYDGVKKAKRVMRGDNPDVVLKGNKVRAFYACIVNPNQSLHCCVDGHAYAIWAGRRINLTEVPNITDKLYRRIEADYAAVAKTISIKTHQLQAITWLTWRRLHGVELKSAA